MKFLSASGSAIGLCVASLLLLGLSCAHPRGAHDSVLPQFAYLKHGGGVWVVNGGIETLVPGTDLAETFAWDSERGGLVITRAGILERVKRDGSKEVVLDGYRAIRFPDVRKTDGAIVVAVTKDAPQESSWRMILILPEAPKPIDLGLGYDPCFTVSGNGVLFEAFDEDTTAVYHLDLNSKKRRRLANGHTVSASVDGAHAYYSADGHLCCCSISKELGSVKQLTSAGDYDRFVSPSPDSSRIIFFRQKGGKEYVVEQVLSTSVERVLLEGNVALPTFGGKVP